MRVGAFQPQFDRLASLFFFWRRAHSWFCCALVLAACAAPAHARQIQVKGQPYIDLDLVGRSFGMQPYWLKGYKTFRLRSQWTTVDVDKKSRVLKMNGMPVYLGFPTVESQGALFIAEADYRHVLQSLLTPQVFPDVPALRRIVLDPGHGGRDSGAINPAYGLEEKELALDVSLRLKTLLEEGGYEVVLTRNDDRYIPLEQRPRIANRARADLFVSIHFNAAASSSASGFETFALTPQHQASSQFRNVTAADAVSYMGNAFDPWNTLLGYALQRSLVHHGGGPDRGLKRARFLVLKHLQCPGVLVELGFMSHSESARKMRSNVYRQTLAQSLFDGIVLYHQRIQRIQ